MGNKNVNENKEGVGVQGVVKDTQKTTQKVGVTGCPACSSGDSIGRDIERV